MDKYPKVALCDQGQRAYEELCGHLGDHWVERYAATHKVVPLTALVIEPADDKPPDWFVRVLKRHAPTASAWGLFVDLEAAQREEQAGRKEAK